jgi:hypothetical protein
VGIILSFNLLPETLWKKPSFLEPKYTETYEHVDASSCTYAHLGIKIFEYRSRSFGSPEDGSTAAYRIIQD